jgi:ubiquitin-conjugating enzyme E2 W
MLGIELIQADDFERWIFSIEVKGESVYAVSILSWLSYRSIYLLTEMQEEKFALLFRFDSQYPISAPAVQFVVGDGYNPPEHPVGIFRLLIAHV